MEAHLLLKKYEDYFEGFPESIVLRCTICKGNCIVGDS